MPVEFLNYLAQVRAHSELREPRLEVEQLGQDKLNEEQRWAREYLKAQGSLFKAVLSLPIDKSSALPKDQEEVLLHYTLRLEGGQVISSSRSEDGGTGVPYHFVLGKQCSEVFGLELGVRQLQKGERCILKILPDYAFEHPKTKERQVSPPAGLDTEATLLYDVELLDHYRVKVVDFEEALVVKRELVAGEGWETPREPFEVEATVQGCALRGDGDGEEAFLEATRVKYAVGDGQLPKGLQMGIDQMCRNEQAWIRCMGKFCTSSSLVPGAPDAQSCPGGHLYRVHLHSFTQVRDLFGTGRVFKRRVRDGEGEFPSAAPMHDCTVRFHYKARTLPDRVVVHDSRGDGNDAPLLEFPIGQGVYPAALETSLRLMCPKEISIVTSTAGELYDTHKELLPDGVDPDKKMEWEVYLDSFDKAANWYSITFEDALKDSHTSKEQGNLLFKKGDYRLARAKYHRCAVQIDGLRGLSQEQYQQISEIQTSCHLNYAQCCIKQGEYHEAIQRLSEKVLKHVQENSKGLYRRALAYIETGFFEEARADLEQLKKVDVESAKDADILLARCRREEQKMKDEEKRSYGGMLVK